MTAALLWTLIVRGLIALGVTALLLGLMVWFACACLGRELKDEQP